MRNSLLSLVSVFAFLIAGCGDGPGQGFCVTFPNDALCQQSVVEIQPWGCESDVDCGGESVCDRRTDTCVALVGDVCQQAFQIYGSGFSEACLTRTGCCFCDCWNNGKQIPETDDPCSCSSIEFGECVDDYLDSSNACLADIVECKSQAAEIVDLYCEY